jgi:hypothetical protein
VATRAKQRRSAVPAAVVRWPQRDLRKHTVEHFGRFFATLRMPDGAGRRVLQDFQLAKLEDYFHEWDDAGELVREGFFENLWLEPTGMGKSTLLGALALHHATYVRVDPRVYVVGGLGGHAANTMDAASGFVQRSEDLGRWWKPTKYGLSTDGSTGALLSLVPEDSDESGIYATSAGRRVGGRAGSAQEGKAPTLILVEETHRHEDNGAAVATLVSKVQKRSLPGQQVQVVHATTAGDSLDTLLGRMLARVTDEEKGAVVQTDLRPGEHYRRAVDADGDLVMHEWAVPEGIAPPDRNTSRVDLDAYLEHVKRAAPADMVTVRSLRLSWRSLASMPWVFLRQHANQWVTADFAAIDRFAWRSCGRGRGWVAEQRAQGNRDAEPVAIPPGKLTSVLLRGAPGVYVGLDTAGRWDSTAIVPTWVDPATRRPVTSGATILGSTHPGAQRRQRNVIEVLLAMRERWPNMALVFDRNYGGGLIAEAFEEDHGFVVVDFNQTGAPMELASMLVGSLVDGGQLEHDEHPELTAHVLAAVMRRSRYGRRWRFEKPRSGEPVDGAVALAMAVYTAMHPPEPDRPPLDVSQYRIEPL